MNIIKKHLGQLKFPEGYSFELGYNFKSMEFQPAIALAQMKNLPNIIKKITNTWKDGSMSQH